MPGESATISMAVNWSADQPISGQMDQISSVQRISGFPWRLCLLKKKRSIILNLVLICDKSSEAILWHCTATVSCNWKRESSSHTFVSWNEARQKQIVAISSISRRRNEPTISVDISVDMDGEMFLPAPVFNLCDSKMKALLIKGRIFKVNMEMLASQSSYFNSLFYGAWKEQNMNEIPIEIPEHVAFEDFIIAYQLISSNDFSSLNEDNLEGILDLADMFDIMIVRDRVLNFILSSSSFISLPKKKHFAERFDMEKALINEEIDSEQLVIVPGRTDNYMDTIVAALFCIVMIAFGPWY